VLSAPSPLLILETYITQAKALPARQPIFSEHQLVEDAD
jgi:hypothetical protein